MIKLTGNYVECTEEFKGLLEQAKEGVSDA